MGSSRIIRSNTKALDAFLAGIGRKFEVRIGIFGATSRESERKSMGGRFSEAEGGGHRVGSSAANLTNADVAAVHELGSPTNNIPARSFLRMPLHQKKEEILKEAKAGAEALLARGDALMVVKRLGIACENAVQRAFATGGFGLWAPLKPATIKRKGSSRELIDSAQMRKAITSKAEVLS